MGDIVLVGQAVVFVTSFERVIISNVTEISFSMFSSNRLLKL